MGVLGYQETSGGAAECVKAYVGLADAFGQVKGKEQALSWEFGAQMGRYRMIPKGL